VQLSATGSPEEAEATYDRLQSRHASILGNLDPNIQRADLGERGVFYRVRVGPWQQRDEAIGVCDALKAAGADCYVTQ
jgi:cell division protein FtsN